ncbi:MAG: substrate-binding domain-containing protein [Spirochaetes bacterium]|nr:substrate-binding domain-containing protein [Spirochaetota bacterium]
MKILFLPNTYVIESAFNIPSFTNLHRGIMDAIRDIDAGIMIYDQHVDLKELYRSGAYMQFDGIIGKVDLAPSWKRDCWDVIRSKVPSVCIIEEHREPCRYVGVDETAALDLLVGHLASEGFRRIGFFAPAYTSYCLKRYRGYRDALAVRGLPLEQRHVYGIDIAKDSFSTEVYYRRRPRAKDMPYWDFIRMTVREYLKRTPLPEAVICCTDAMAWVFMEEAAANGLRIPEHVAVCGIDDGRYFGERYRVPDAYLEKPFLTSVSVPYYDIGSMGVYMLADIASGMDIPADRKILLPPRLAVRRSTVKRSAVRPHGDVQFYNSAASFIEEHYRESGLSEKLSNRFEMSKKYFSQKFKREFGSTFVTRVNDFRLDKAARYLAGTHRPVIDIMFGSGFNSVPNFNTLFRKKFGCTPSVYRKRRLQS